MNSSDKAIPDNEKLREENNRLRASIALEGWCDTLYQALKLHKYDDDKATAIATQVRNDYLASKS